MNIEQLIETLILDNIATTLSDLYENRHSFGNSSSSQSSLIKRFFKQLTIRGEFDAYSYLYNELKRFENEFNKYISKQTAETTDFKINVLSLFNSLINKNQKAFILSFNYTDIAPLLDPKQLYGQINHIHGIQGKDIIIGYDSSNILSVANKGIRLSKAWQKLNDDIPLIGLPDKTLVKEIIFYGHSLGKQDYSYFHAIFDYYNIYNSPIRLNFCYTPFENIEHNNEIIRNDYVTKIYTLLSDYAQKSSNEAKVVTIISRLQLENRLHITQIDKIP